MYSPRHTAGHILDHVITRRGDSVFDIKVGSFVSDYRLVTFKLDVKQPCLDGELVPCRQWKKLSLPDFEADIRASRLVNLSESQLVDLSSDEWLTYTTAR